MYKDFHHENYTNIQQVGENNIIAVVQSSDGHQEEYGKNVHEKRRKREMSRKQGTFFIFCILGLLVFLIGFGVFGALVHDLIMTIKASVNFMIISGLVFSFFSILRIYKINMPVDIGALRSSLLSAIFFLTLYVYFIYCHISMEHISQYCMMGIFLLLLFVPRFAYCFCTPPMKLHHPLAIHLVFAFFIFCCVNYELLLQVICSLFQ